MPAADRVQVASSVQASPELRIVDLPACLLFQDGQIRPDQLHHRPGGLAGVPVGDGDGQLTLASDPAVRIEGHRVVVPVDTVAVLTPNP